MVGGDHSGVTGVVRSVDLPGARRLRIRHIVRQDEEALGRLFAGLCDDDLYHRFFQAHMPGTRTLQAMVSTAERGGVGLVAEGVDSDGLVDVVGEATVERLPGGDGELAITVARRWRGWLGPYLLDALVEAAAARGIPDLEADILLENRPMLALVRARGFVTLDHYEYPSIVRVAIGAERSFPTWPGPHDRPRVLVEAVGGRWHAEVAARAAGFQVVVCPGPRAGTSYCAPMRGLPCPLAAAADVIVADIPADKGGGKLLEAHRALHRGVPICLEPPAATGGRTTRRRQGAGMDDVATAVAMLRRVARGVPVVCGSSSSVRDAPSSVRDAPRVTPE